MFKHGALLRSRLVVAFLAATLFVVPVAAQMVIISVDTCWWNCHQSTKRKKEAKGLSLKEAQEEFVDCMNEHCGGMGEGS